MLKRYWVQILLCAVSILAAIAAVCIARYIRTNVGAVAPMQVVPALAPWRA